MIDPDDNELPHVFLIRHAIASPRDEEPSMSDEERPLTDTGRKKFRRVVEGLKRLGVSFDHLYHSPLLRAVQTADMMTPLLRTARTMVTPLLVAEPDRALLDQIEGGRRIALVGHEPYLSQTAAWLLFGDKALAARIELKKGGVVWLEGRPQPGHMRLRALLPPKVW